MNFLIKNIFIALSFFALFVINAEADVRVSAQVDTSQDIYVGESFGYYIIIEGSDKAGQVEMKALQEYNPQPAGNRQQSSTQIINNRVTTTQTLIMTYSLTANSTGLHHLPAVTVTLDGKSYQTNPVEVNILKPGTTDQLDMEVTLSEQQCYVGQPVIMTIKFYISADIGDFGFNIPAFTSDDFYIEEPDVSNQQARQYDLGNGVIVSVSQSRTVHNGKDSILLSFSKVLIPRHSGEIAISPASVSADVAVGIARSQDRFFNDFFGSRKEYKRFMVSSQPLKLTVLSLPEEGKPSGFYGLVGQYTITASATPTKVSVGDPITLTIKVGGGKYLKPVKWPALEEIPELADNFKIPSEKASPTIENGCKIFTQTIRANNDKIDEIPSIPLAYFDADEGKYDVAKTGPIKLDVSPTKILTGADLEGLDFTPVNKEVEAIKKGLSANYEGLNALTNQTFSPLAASVAIPYVFVWAGPLALLVISTLVKFLTYTTPEKVAAKRRRTAAGKAISQLKRISSHTAEKQQCELLASVMKQYLGDSFDRTAGSLTSGDCFEIIDKATKNAEIAKKYQEIIADCEAARYASSKTNIDNAYVKEVIKLIRDVDKKSKKL
jgi:hypothetical protein